MSIFLNGTELQHSTGDRVKLLIQPENGIKPLIDALKKAKTSIKIVIFRFDRMEIEKALVAAVARGVAVQALIAFTNQGEERNLRRLEMRLLAQGITVTRTADDLARYHGKMIIIDERMLYLLGFNFTHIDIDLSRSFGVAITKPAMVKEALRLFDCDAKRRPYTSRNDDLVVSPVNARRALTELISGARKRLLIYEMKISDRNFVALLNKKISEGVEVKVLSRAPAKNGTLPVRRLPLRMHLRAILRDDNCGFVGSQSLKKLELEARREVGIIFRDKGIVKKMESVFDKDWKRSEPLMNQDKDAMSLIVPAKRVAKEVAKHVAIKPVVEQVLDKIIEKREDASFEPEEVAQTVREAFHDEVAGAVGEALREVMIDQFKDEQEKQPRNGKQS
jgi:phosphatidylserine/phosphatidylglycerophosphate/cardiolipin synthase-like enzyme